VRSFAIADLPVKAARTLEEIAPPERGGRRNIRPEPETFRKPLCANVRKALSFRGGKSMYDARGPASFSGSSQNALFGVLTVVVVIAAFAAAFFLPDLLGGGGKGGASPVAAAARTEDKLLARIEAEDPRLGKIFVNLRAVDPEGYARFSSKMTSASSQTEILTHTQTWLTEAFEGSADLLTKIDVRHVNALTDLSMKGLNELARSGSQYCKVSFWEKYEDMPQAQIQAEFMKLGQSAQPGGALYNFSLDALVIASQALRDAREKPQSYGPMTASDQMELQGMVQSFMMSPEIMPLLMGGNNRAAASNVNLCNVGVSALRSFRNLPDPLKGRLIGSANPATLNAGALGMR
jgi:hypothetical protein